MSTLMIVCSSPACDAMKLHRAFKGYGCDTSAVINILAHRDASQRANIMKEYNSAYGEELTKRLSSELSGSVQRAVVLWMYDPAQRDAVILNECLTISDIDVKAATEVICSRTPSQLHGLKLVYYSLFGTEFHHAIHAQTSGALKQLLLAYLGIPRNEGSEIDRSMVNNDAKALFEAGQNRFGTDEKTFIRIFCERSGAHMAAVSSAYHDMYGKTLKEVIKSETSGHFMHGLVTILQCAENPGVFFAKVLRKAMKGMGTDDKSLMRVIVTRAEIDMQFIKAEYHKKYHKSLIDVVHSETSSYFRTFLVSLLGPNHH